jgi:hypothetical protein
VELRQLADNALQRLAAAVAVSLILAAVAPAFAGTGSIDRGQSSPPLPAIHALGAIWTVAHGEVVRNGVPDTASGTAFRLRYWNGNLMVKRCAWYRLATPKWPAGDAGWEQLATSAGEIYYDCPPRK